MTGWSKEWYASANCAFTWWEIKGTSEAQ